MDFFDINKINTIIEGIPNIDLVRKIEHKELFAEGKISVSNFDRLQNSLEFEVKISPQYPLKNHESESINFINQNLIEYNHVMGDGSICIHTLHSHNLKKKLYLDFDALKNWVVKYYINKDNDSHYEHIIVNETTINDIYYSYQFTDIEHSFRKGDYGGVNLTLLNKATYKESPIANYLVQSFHFVNDSEYSCNWSKYYKGFNDNNSSMGIFVFLKDTPAHNKRFAYRNWLDFEENFSDEFLTFLYDFKKSHQKKNPKSIFPIFIGYETIENEIHWIASMCRMDEFPTEGVKINQQWSSQLRDMTINWGITRNSSYKYLFGRGVFCSQLTNSKILIIGVGAIGSLVAKTLVKCGVKYIDLVDYDVKEPENVCRSEYQFSTGLTDKVEELRSYLITNSPFVEVELGKKEYFETLIKVFHKNSKAKKEFEKVLSEYDLIFDCSTDNDLMYILSTLSFNSDLINLSITNHAKDLVCAFHPNTYRFVNNQFTNVLNNDIEDLYNPTGCWSPTFRASYNDINVLVQYALKHINSLYKEEKPKNNFTLSVDEENNLNIKLTEY